MRGRAVTAALAVCLAAGLTASGCVENTAPGNDRESHLEPPTSPAPVASAADATSGVATGVLYPQTLTDADLTRVPDEAAACLFRFTEVGLPALAYGSSAVVKLNGKLVPLPRMADGRYGEAGVEVTVRPLEDGSEYGSPFPAEMVLRLPGAPNELGFHGFAVCR